MMFSTKVDPFGLISKDIFAKAELRLEALKSELAKRFSESGVMDNYSSGLGGDPFFYFLMSADEHCVRVDGQLTTAATTGSKYFWNPFFVDAMSPSGLRFVLGHEIAHTFLNHVPRMKGRHSSIHNWCVDYFANNLVLSDLRQRFENLQGLSSKVNSKDYYAYYLDSMHCSNPMTLERAKQYMLDPVACSYDRNNDMKIKLMIEDSVVPSGMQRECAYKSNMEIAFQVKNKTFEFFVEKAIPEQLHTPEALYDELVRTLKKCPNCNRVGMFPVPSKVRNNVSSIFNTIKHKYPTADVLLDLLKDVFKANNVALKNNGNEIPDSELTNERRFIDTLQGKNNVEENKKLSEDLKKTDKDVIAGKDVVIEEVEHSEEDKVLSSALDQYYEKVQDLFYAAVKESMFFDYAKIPDSVIKEGRAVKEYNIHFLKSIVAFINYIMSELDSIDKNRSLDEVFDVLKKSISNTLSGYFLLKAKMTHNITKKEEKDKKEKKISTEPVVENEEENDTSLPYDPTTATPDNDVRIYNDDEEMFQLIKNNTQSILSEFDLWGGYSDYIDSLVNPKWVNVEALDCKHCCDKVDIFKFNKNKMVYHIGQGASGEDEEGEEGDGKDKNLADALAKNKLANALMYAKQAGYVPAGFEEMIGNLSKSKMRWQDKFRTVRKDTEDDGRNDYTRYKSKHFSFGVLTPKKTNRVFKVAVLCDTSGSMDMQNDITYGISQLTNLSGSSGYLTWADAEIYWDQTIELSKFTSETLKGIKAIGRGGTSFLKYFNEYDKKIKDDNLSMIVVITDGYLYEGFEGIKKPKIPVMWLITNHGKFSPPFGQVFNIHND